MSAIYYDQGRDVKVKQCKTIITFDTIPESKILDAMHVKMSLEFLKLNILLIVYSVDWNCVNAHLLLVTTY